MKTKLLRKLRKEARKRYRVVSYPEQMYGLQKESYKVQVYTSLSSNYGPKKWRDISYPVKDKELAIKNCKLFRDYFISEIIFKMRKIILRVIY